MGYLRKIRYNQHSEPHTYTYEPPLPEILDPRLNVKIFLLFVVVILRKQNMAYKAVEMLLQNQWQCS